MPRFPLLVFFCTLGLIVMAASIDEVPAIAGFSKNSSRIQREWEQKFRAIPSTENMKEYMKRLSARPQHVGSPYDKANADWSLSRVAAWGLDAHIEPSAFLFPA